MHKLFHAVAIGALVSLAGPTMARTSTASLVGLWKVVSVSVKNPANQVLKPLGDNPGGYILYTKRGRFVLIQLGSNRTPPATPTPSESEAAKLFTTMAAVYGTYKNQTKDTYIAHVDNSSIPTGLGTDQLRVCPETSSGIAEFS